MPETSSLTSSLAPPKDLLHSLNRSILQQSDRWKKQHPRSSLTEVAPHLFLWTQNIPNQQVEADHRAANAEGFIEVALLCGNHGNEIGGLHTLMTWLERLSEEAIKKLPSSLLIGTLNVDALQVGKRFIDRDMNRCYGTQGPHLDLNLAEHKRLQQVESYLKRCLVILDLHQTQKPCAVPFFPLSHSREALSYTSFIAHDERIIVYPKSQQPAEKGMSLGRFAAHHGHVGIAIETGYMGFDPEQVTYGLGLIDRLLEFEYQRREAGSHAATPYTGASISPELPSEATFWTAEYGHICQHPEAQLKAGVHNFYAMEQGEEIGADGSTPILAPGTGELLFPKRIAGQPATQMQAGEYLFMWAKPLEPSQLDTYFASR